MFLSFFNFFYKDEKCDHVSITYMIVHNNIIYILLFLMLLFCTIMIYLREQTSETDKKINEWYSRGAVMVICYYTIMNDNYCNSTTKHVTCFQNSIFMIAIISTLS